MMARRNHRIKFLLLGFFGKIIMTLQCKRKSSRGKIVQRDYRITQLANKRNLYLSINYCGLEIENFTNCFVEHDKMYELGRRIYSGNLVTLYGSGKDDIHHRHGVVIIIPKKMMIFVTNVASVSSIISEMTYKLNIIQIHATSAVKFEEKIAARPQ